MSHPTRSSWIATVLFVLAASGCETNKRVEPPQSFASDWAGTMGGPRGSYESGAKNGDAGVGGSVDNPQRTIAEADIVALDGDRLYALSRWAGLSVIDLADPDQPKLLGRYRDTHEAQPFEMYVREGVAFVLLSGWGQYNAKDDGTGYEWVQTSKVLAIDTADPNAMTVVGVFDVPGAISDSRLVGDVLYVVGYQDGTCFGCSKAQPRTSVV
ncbi:MAG TPA: beta-propeller domain-containing protein, partial [Polyangiales bacterium]|nr:beta-propeller domain-containing protein [Polyangiales bacterium]